MVKTNKLLVVDLSLFAEGAAAIGNATSSADSSLATKGNAPKVVYGKQEQAQPTEQQDNSTDLEAEYEEAIKGKFKDIHEARIKQTINQRFKNQPNLQAELDKTTPILERLKEKYGTATTNPEDILAALDDDDSYYEAEAIERDMSVEQLKEIKKLERTVKQQDKQIQAYTQHQKAQETYQEWIKQSTSLKEKYPNFNIETELKSDNFRKLLSAGLDVETAFTVVHKDELIPAAMQYTANQVKQGVVNDILANGTRPIENGIQDSSAIVTKTDPSKLTKKDLAEIRKRVARGERIVF